MGSSSLSLSFPSSSLSSSGPPPGVGSVDSRLAAEITQFGVRQRSPAAEAETGWESRGEELIIRLDTRKVDMNQEIIIRSLPDSGFYGMLHER